MTVKNGRLISYRQYLRSYSAIFSQDLPDNFVTALDSFVNEVDSESKTPTVIEDIYIGYLDSGDNGDIHAAWLAKTSDGKIYRYEEKSEVAQQ